MSEPRGNARRTNLDVHQDAIDRTGLSRVQHVDTFLTVASEHHLTDSLLDELPLEDGSIDLIVLQANRISPSASSFLKGVVGRNR